MSAFKDELTYRAYAAGWAIVRLLPERVAYGAFRMAADRAWRRRGKGVRRLESNLARVLGPDATEERIRQVSKQGMRNYLRYYCDTFRLETWSHARVNRTIVVENEQMLRDTLASGRGVILALPHMGNWDHAGAWAAQVADGFTTVAERLKPEKLFERWLRYRESIGMEVLPLTGGSGTFGGLMRRLRGGGLVCLVAERDLTDSGVPVEFFGETTKLPAGPAALAAATGAALMPVTLWYDETSLQAKVWPELVVPAEGTKQEKVAALCQQLADCFAEGISDHPADWHMLQRLWLVDLDPAKAPVPKAAAAPDAVPEAVPDAVPGTGAAPAVPEVPASGDAPETDGDGGTSGGDGGTSGGDGGAAGVPTSPAAPQADGAGSPATPAAPSSAATPGGATTSSSADGRR